MQTRSARVLAWLRAGVLKPRVGGVYPLASAGQAHADLEARRTTGKLVLNIAG